MRKLLLTFICFGTLLMNGCFKVPSGNSSYTIEYSVNAGSDMLSLFDFEVSYVNEKMDVVKQKITKIPWSKQFKMGKNKNEADLKLLLKAKNPRVTKDIYDVGVTVNIKDTKSTKNVIESPYTKAGDQIETLRFSVKLPAGKSASDLKITIPALKYNKHMAFSYIADDNVVGAYGRIWSRTNRKWVDNEKYSHMGMKPTIGYIPKNTLGYTDGCGIEKRFPVGVSISPNVWNESAKSFRIKDNSTSKDNPYITWDELAPILDFGGAVYQHNVDEREFEKDQDNEELISKGFKDDIEKTFNKLGRKMKILAQPDGNEAYLNVAMSSSDFHFYRTNQLVGNKLYLNNEMSLYRKYTYSGFTEDTDAKLTELEEQSKSSNPYLVCMTTHEIGEPIIPMLEKINDLYGKDGLDNLWYATLDEIYEYSVYRSECESQITQSVNGDVVTYEVKVNSKDNFYYKDLSFVIEGITEKTEVKPLSDNIMGLSSGIDKGKMLINVNFNPQLKKLAEKYTARYEITMDDADKDDAEYFVSQLTPDLQGSYLSRISKTENSPLTINSFLLNYGAKSTPYDDVFISIDKVTPTPEFYRIGIKSDLSDGQWVDYSIADIKYILSRGYGTKNIYIQCKRKDKLSNIVSSEINFVEKTVITTITKHHLEKYLNEYDNCEITISNKK